MKSATKTVHLSPAAYVLRLFGGASTVARDLRLSRTSPARWCDEGGGLVPAKHHLPLLLLAGMRGLDLKESHLIHGADVPE